MYVRRTVLMENSGCVVSPDQIYDHFKHNIINNMKVRRRASLQLSEYILFSKQSWLFHL